ncbi:hypothetical protein D9M72_458500 [compost metagenome]
MDCAAAPRKKPWRFSESSVDLELLWPGGRPRLTQCMPCCAAKIAICCSVASLSPEREAALVKPAATLLAHLPPLAKTLREVASIKPLNCAEALPM